MWTAPLSAPAVRSERLTQTPDRSAATVGIAKARAFALVIEGVAGSLARELTSAVAAPTIGVGGSPACDGQILVIDDRFGLFTSSPRNSSSAIAAPPSPKTSPA